MNKYFNKIILGIDEHVSIDMLLEKGVRQFYFGFLDKLFFEKYGSQISVNRRYKVKEQFTDYDKALETINKIHLNNGTVYLALNGFMSNNILLNFTKEQISIFADKVDGIIVANINTALYLKHINYKNIVLSNLFGIYNSASVSFFSKIFNPIKYIFPRDISLNNISDIVKKFPEYNFECFLFGDNCRYSESFCFSEHGYNCLGADSLCQFTWKRTIPVKTIDSNFKSALKNKQLSESEKKQILDLKNISIESLLNKLEEAIYNNNNNDLVDKVLNKIERYNISYLQQSKNIFFRLKNILKTINSSTSLKILSNLPNEYPQVNNYEVFNKTNNIAIMRTLEFLSKHKNIVSYKIPSRGRDFSVFLEQNSNLEKYDYTKSQYELNF